jgi:hypothetical protein
MVSLLKVKASAYELGVDITHAEKAIDELRDFLDVLNDVSVKGRDNVDTLLGCMMAIEAIIGDEKNG